MEQGTTAWLHARAGKITASRIADVMAKTKTGWGASRKNYAAQLIAERLTGVPQESGFTNAAMQWGTETEPRARAMYEFTSGQMVTETGFVPHPTITGSGASPDGLVSTDGLLEIKCPNTATHLETLEGAPIADKYVKQMHWQMICCQRDWCDFVSFDPRLPDSLQMVVQHVPLDPELAEQITKDVSDFNTEINERVAAIIAKYEKEI